MKKFWMLYADDAGPPLHKHLTPEAAMAEASRIAARTGRPIYLLEAIKVGTPVNIEWQPLEELT